MHHAFKKRKSIYTKFGKKTIKTGKFGFFKFSNKVGSGYPKIFSSVSGFEYTETSQEANSILKLKKISKFFCFKTDREQTP